MSNYTENYEESDPKKEDNIYHWETNDDLRYCKHYYYKKYPSVKINVLIQNNKIGETSEDKKGRSNDDDSDSK